MKFIAHLIWFVGLLVAMWVLTFIPFGLFVNFVIILYALWRITK